MHARGGRGHGNRFLREPRKIKLFSERWLDDMYQMLEQESGFFSDEFNLKFFGSTFLEKFVV